MSTALIVISSVLTPLQGLWHWLMPIAPGHCAPSGKVWHGALSAKPSDASRACFTGIEQRNLSTVSTKTLRVVRILEADQAPAQAGRLRISGRMADVCAELDRLAARESSLH